MTHHHAAFVPLTKQVVADHLGISVRSVENWINEGIMPAPVKLGNRVYWHPDIFYGWLSNRLHEGAAVEHEVTSTPLAKKPQNNGSNGVGGKLRASTEKKLGRLLAND